MSRWNRTNFYNSAVINGKTERDLISNFFNTSFQVKRPLRYYQLERGDIQRPDILSIKFYGKLDYWWIIAKYNAIDDWWNDVTPGDVISVPSKADIDDFYLEAKKKMKDVNK